MHFLGEQQFFFLSLIFFSFWKPGADIIFVHFHNLLCKCLKNEQNNDFFSFDKKDPMFFTWLMVVSDVFRNVKNLPGNDLFNFMTFSQNSLFRNNFLWGDEVKSILALGLGTLSNFTTRNKKMILKNCQLKKAHCQESYERICTVLKSVPLNQFHSNMFKIIPFEWNLL